MFPCMVLSQGSNIFMFPCIIMVLLPWKHENIAPLRVQIHHIFNSVAVSRSYSIALDFVYLNS